MKKKKQSFIFFVLWLVLALCWALLVFIDIKRADASAGQILMHLLFMVASGITSFAEYKKYKNYTE